MNVHRDGKPGILVHLSNGRSTWVYADSVLERVRRVVKSEKDKRGVWVHTYITDQNRECTYIGNLPNYAENERKIDQAIRKLNS
jgi:hypothetical protein